MATTPNRTWSHISGTGWSFDIKLITQTQDTIIKSPINCSDLWPLGGAIFSINAFLVISLYPLVQTSQMRYRWNPWIMTSPPYDVNFRLTRFSAILDFVENLKKFSAATNFDRLSRKLAQRIFGPIRKIARRLFFQFQLCSPTTTNQSWRRRRRQTRREAISQQSFDIKLLTQTQDHFSRRPKNFGDLWPLGGAIFSKNAFLLISFYPLVQISQMRYYWNPWMLTRSNNSMTSLAPSWIFRHFELYPKPSKTITGHLDCLISMGLDT